MKIGKLSNEQLKEIVINRLRTPKDVILASSVGEDCAAIEFGDEACVLSTDPITGASENIGSLAVHVSGNDVASSGAEPRYMLATLLAPPDKTVEDIKAVVDDLIKTADELGISIIGGHTEVTDAVTRIVLSTTVIGRVQKDKLVSSSGAKDGDALIMTKYAGLEGTSIIVSERKEELKDVLTELDIEQAQQLKNELSVVKEGLAAAGIGVSAMHDITEGGVYGAVHELCTASGVGCELYSDDIPVLEVTKKLCSYFRINEKRLIGSGSMLITSDKPELLLKEMEKAAVKATVIGRVTGNDITVIENGVKGILSPPQPDELFSI